ncbi:tail fiber domain-containing protein [Pantoea sp. CTOTU49201]|uniref:tail fiber domain-containing protein n=1 Tax=Pantoea sp. CTOTU49201 TaxID=2953855 RepID=UPI00289D401E|nr:tail fiber domain-containing protein [Pantoea sp. CTOTU49201]
MPAGTIALTNNSATVTGTGTSFTTEFKVGDFVGVVVGGAPYTMIVASVASNTQLSLSVPFNGPSASGLAWYAVPASLKIAITQQTLNDVGTNARGMILQMDNWQKIYSDAASVTVTRTDRSTFTGPSWGYMSTQFGNKANTADVLTKADNLSSLTDKSAARTNMGVAYGTTAGTVAQGNDSRLNTVGNKTGGTISSAVTINGITQIPTSGAYFYSSGSVTESNNNMTTIGMRIAGNSSGTDIYLRYNLVSGNYHAFQLVQSSAETFRVQSNGYAYATSFNNTSDSNLKFNKEFIADALLNTMSMRGMSYSLQGSRKAGVIAQDVQKFLPEAVSTSNDPIVLEDGTILNETLSLDYSAIAGLHTEAIKSFIPLMMEMLISPESAKEKLSSLISAINTSSEDANPTDLKMEWALLNPPTSPVMENLVEEDEHENSHENGS